MSTSPARVFAILDLFTIERPTWSADEINRALGYTRPTGYRYVKELVDAGFLQKAGSGRYALGARIIMLDFQLRQTDPVLQTLMPRLDQLVRRSSLDAVVTAALHDQLVDTYRASLSHALALRYGRGRARPVFCGAAAKVLMAYQPRSRQDRWYLTQSAEQLQALGLGSIQDFRRQLGQIRAEGGYLSLGELDPGVGGYAIPLFDGDGELRCALTLVGRNGDLLEHGPDLLRQWLMEATAGFAEDLVRVEQSDVSAAEQFAAEAKGQAATSDISVQA